MQLRVAAKAFILNDDGQVLILREHPDHITGTQPGKYHLPGGKLEPDEAFLDGLHREVLEETGLSGIEVLRPLHVDEWHPIIGGTTLQIIGMYMLCCLRGQVPPVQTGLEHDQAEWINPADYKQYELLDAEQRAFQAFLDKAAAM